MRLWPLVAGIGAALSRHHGVLVALLLCILELPLHPTALASDDGYPMTTKIQLHGWVSGSGRSSGTELAAQHAVHVRTRFLH